MRPDLSSLLDEALERIRAGASIEECLRAYPDHAKELEPMLRTAAAIRRQASSSLPLSLEQWLASGRAEIEQIARQSYARRSTPLSRLGRWLRELIGGLSRRGLPRLASATLSATVICIMAVYTVDAAAASSLPGDYLYGWKLFSEQTRISLTVDPDRRAQLVAASVERRVAEIGALAESGQADAEHIASTVEQLDSQVRQALDALPDASPAVRDHTVARIGLLLERAESDLREAAPENQPVPDNLAIAAETVVAIIEVLPAEPPADAAVVVRVPTPTAVAAPRPATGPVAGGVAPPITAPNPGDGPATQLPVAPPLQPSPTETPSTTATTAADTLPPGSTPTEAPTAAVSSPTRTALPTRTVLPVTAPSSPTPTAPLTSPQPISPALPTATSGPTLTPATPIVAPTLPVSDTTPTVTRTALPSDPTRSPEPSDTTAPTATRTPDPSDTAAPTATRTPEPVPSDTPPTATRTAAPIASRTPEPVPSDTPQPTATRTAAPAASRTPEPVPSDTPQPTATRTAAPTASRTPEPEPSDTPQPTVTATPDGPNGGLKPLLECVLGVDDDTYIAYFGYRNNKPGSEEIPIGPNNRFLGEPADRGQPTRFPAGRSAPYPNTAFSVMFDGDPITWLLNGDRATASRNSRECDD